MAMPGRTYTATTTSGFRYGFNGKELDKEVAGTTTYDYGFRIYSPGLGRFLSVDPLMKNYPSLSTYQSTGNSPLKFIDLDGGEPKHPPYPGMEGMIVHAPKIGGPNSGEILIWTANNGKWINSSSLPVTVQSNGSSKIHNDIYTGPSTYYDVAEATTGIPEGIQFADLNIEFNGLFSWCSYTAQPVFTKQNEINYYVVGNWIPVIDQYGYHSVWQNIMIINREDIAEMTFEKINALGWGMRASFKSRMCSAKGDFLGATIQNWKDVNSDPMNWLGGAMIYAGGLPGEKPIKGTLNTGEKKVLFRGGQPTDENLMKLKEKEYKVNENPNAKYNVRGLSLTGDRSKAVGFGGSNALTFVPKGLKAIHTPSTFDPHHFDLVPINPNISEASYQKLLNQVKLKPIK